MRDRNLPDALSGGFLACGRQHGPIQGPHT